MKGFTLLQLAALSTAFVLPNDQVNNLQHVAVNADRHSSFFDKIPSKAELIADLKDTFEDAEDNANEVIDRVASAVSSKAEEQYIGSKHALDEALEFAGDLGDKVETQLHDSFFDAQAWMDSAVAKEIDMEQVDLFSRFSGERDDKPHPPGPPGPPAPPGPPEAPTPPPPPPHEDPHHPHEPPHHGPPGDHPPHHGPPHDGPPHHGPPHDGPPHHGSPHHGGPGHKSNLTVYQLISTSNYSTKLTKWINEFPDIVDALNSTDVGNITVFAPIDSAFDKIPEHAPKPSKETLKKILSYHISPEFYPAGRVLVTRTIPTLLVSEELGDKPLPQRLSTNIGPRGLTVNFYSRIIAVDIFGTNGVIHGVDSIILPPPDILSIIQLLPSEFSTLELGLQKTGLLDELNGTHAGGTFFAPSNFAFQKLGPRINAFLFSAYGQKYLKALLTYHVVREGNTLYSDAFYHTGEEDEEMFKGKCHGRRSFGGGEHGPEHGGPPHHGPPGEHGPEHGGPPHGPPRVPRGFFHVTLPTLLEDKSLNIDIARYGRLIDIRINGFSHVVVSDGVAKDGVIHVVGDVLIPPKKLGETTVESAEDMSVEELKERLEPYVKEQRGWFDL